MGYPDGSDKPRWIISRYAFFGICFCTSYGAVVGGGVSEGPEMSGAERAELVFASQLGVALATEKNG